MDDDSERKTLTDQQIEEAERIIAEDAAEMERLKQEFFVQGPSDSVDEHDPLTPPASPAPPRARR